MTEQEPINPMETIAELIKSRHRTRRFAMKVQQKVDRALESFLRVRFTDWSPDMDEAEREKCNAVVRRMIKEQRTIIKAAQAADGALSDHGGDEVVTVLVLSTDNSRSTWDKLRKDNEEQMGRLAQQLPVWEWVKDVPGFGALGLATIIAETGPLDNYANPQKVWKRLGFAPYDGFAGSTWKREKWRPRALKAEEWTENPFSGSRYALMSQIVTWLVNKQWIGAAKTDSGEGEPNGLYGQVYYDRRQHTARTHPDWSKKHAQRDALRITMKRLLLDLWLVWHGKEPKTKQHTNVVTLKRKSVRRPSAKRVAA